MTDPSQDRIYDWLAPHDVEAASEIEKRGYPPDEASSLDTIKYRQTNANDLFLGVYDSGSHELLGYVCGTLSPSESFIHESMYTHVPNSSSVCIHSLCISSQHQRKGIGRELLREYISRLRKRRQEDSPSYDRILLLTHEELRPFYENAGFEWIGPSQVVFGSRPWFDMRMMLGPPPSEVSSAPPSLDVQQLPPGIWEQLQRSSRDRPLSRSLSSFPNGLSDVATDSLANKYDLLCPRGECSSIILKHGVAQLVERSSVQMEPSGYTPHPLLPPLPTPPANTRWWLITPSPMAFENIGFSKPVQQGQVPSPTPGKTLKLLSCAECDLAPLGWTEGGSEFWLACERVGYRA